MTGVVLAIPAAALVTTAVEMRRTRDLTETLERVVRSQINDQVRERCESDSNWFLTGPLIGRPPRGLAPDPVNPDPMAPRPKLTDQAFELFAYDEQFAGTSMAAPRFPLEFRQELQRGTAMIGSRFASSAGSGAQIGMPTGWVGGPCMYFLGRMKPPAGQLTTRVLMMSGLSVLFFAIVWLAQQPTLRRVFRLSRDAQASVKEGHAAIAPDQLKDELSSVTFVYNDVATELHQRKARIADQDEALRRYVTHTVDDVSKPIAEVERHLAALASGHTGGDANPEIVAAVLAGREAATLLENLSASARLRMSGEIPREDVNLGAVIGRVLERYQPMARMLNVVLTSRLPSTPVTLSANAALLERAVGNLVDNALRYNRPGGHVTVTLEADAGPRAFSLRVTDDGPGLTDDQFKGITAVRRFRGDEAHNRRPGAPGLGLALAREVADQSGLVLTFRRPAPGGFETELSRR